MRIKVIKEFVDKHTNKLHKVGSFFDCDETRFAEILKAGKFAEKVVELKSEQPKKEIIEK